VQTKQQPAHTPNTFETAVASARSTHEPVPMADAGSTLLREVSIGANVYVALRDIAPESLLASNPSEAAQHKQAGWRRATLSFS